MKKILLSIAVIGVAGALAISASNAIFSDVEISAGNTFKAGGLDLLVDNTQHYAGMVCEDVSTDPDVLDYIWVEEESGSSARPDMVGDVCNGTWLETDLGPKHQFFNFEDVKPGDEGENTISLHLEGNDAYMCVIIDNLENNDNGCNEPEGKVDDTCGDPGVDEGELADELYFFAWSDDGDNIWEDGEMPLLEGPANNILGGVAYPIYTPVSTGGVGPMASGDTVYIGLYWCLGNIIVDVPTNTLTCDGASATNITQTDSLTGDVTFYVEQARNNPNFECSIPDPEPTEGTITVIKEVITDNGGTLEVDDFPLNIDGDPVTSGVPETLSPGAYTVGEIGQHGYQATFSGACDEYGTVNLGAGENLVCTITNDDIGPSITLVKVVDGGSAGPDSFDLTLGGDIVLSGATTVVDAGVAYIVNETVLPNYTFMGITGDIECPAGLGGTITLGLAENATCTLTNDYDLD
ncbi:MAG: hypothetical protein KAS07_03840 [Candidatus Pacebacteria bacterium]|nr:hypothetical protein [Candidatus Paceibacterota bacterium]